jgi:hypothetical protein
LLHKGEQRSHPTAKWRDPAGTKSRRFALQSPSVRTA